MKKIIIIPIVLVVAAVLFFRLSAVKEKNQAQNSDLLNIGEVSVTVADVILGNASFKINTTGALYPNRELDIPAETQGRITTLNLWLGKYVSEGSVIATIDNTLKKNSYESLKTEVEKLKKDYDRTVVLFKNATASEQEVENAKLSYENAVFRLNEAEKQLAYTKITSSIAGIVTKKNVELGSYVNPGTVIASIVDISKLKARMFLSEANVYNLKIGNKAQITSDVYKGKTFEGQITYISPSADDSHNYLVEIEMNNNSKTPLKAGTFVAISIEIPSSRETLLIPRQALQGSVKDAQVYLAENGKAVLKKIEVGKINNEYIEVLSGIKATDKVIISGQVNLSNGKEIKIININE
jgi:RND family efflux transporter MFP subunit